MNTKSSSCHEFVSTVLKVISLRRNCGQDFYGPLAANSNSPNACATGYFTYLTQMALLAWNQHPTWEMTWLLPHLDKNRSPAKSNTAIAPKPTGL
jgi:hypothetical protein